MANLVPLHIDKETGEIVATRNPGVGGGTSTAPGLQGAEGWLHIQSVASDTWTIPHNQGSDLVLVQVYTTAGELIIPDDVTIVDINTIEILFAAPDTGRAHIIFFETP